MNAKNRMGAYIGNHQFVIDTLIGLALVNDDLDATKALKSAFNHACRNQREHQRRVRAQIPPPLTTPPHTKTHQSLAILKAEDFQASTDKSDSFCSSSKNRVGSRTARSKHRASCSTPTRMDGNRGKIQDRRTRRNFIATNRKDPLPGRYGQKGRARNYHRLPRR